MVKGPTSQRVRLYVRGTILRYKSASISGLGWARRSKQIQMNTEEDVAWYGAKMMAYVYKAKSKNDTNYHCIWGKVSHPHGNVGVVRAKFTPADASGELLGRTVVLLFDVLTCVAC
ncbi:LOW QUALITY PROTEIN: hypothetical protein CFC21_083392 [Triticum aestivum]|uniref:Ribosomal protein L35Ae n=2 Tax=Triticum aestivum TaxID=4565 RepID=A0A9R1I7Y3_WHEAT|nr:LOW QUALITY PROTEIN: hypothetical protein CFC21_083392 [Triticum aestivum]